MAFVIIIMSAILIKHTFLKLDIKGKYYLYTNNKSLKILYLSLIAIFKFLIPIKID